VNMMIGRGQKVPAQYHHYYRRGRGGKRRFAWVISQLIVLLLLYSMMQVTVLAKERNPYDVLGVHKSASIEEIRKHYKFKCLKNHPDKTVHLSEEERMKREEEFKEIQHAHSLIGDEVSRKNFDAQERLRSFRSESFSSWGGGRHRSAFSSSGSSANVHFDSFFTHPFYRSGTQPFFFRREGFPDSKSIYIQTVEIPLEDLFSGVAEKKFTLQDSFVERYKAAFRGGIGQRVALQSFTYFLTMLLRTNVVASGLIALTTLHLNIPKPSKLIYKTSIKRGWKTGTKLTFDILDSPINVVFILKEKHHDTFQRVGDELHTVISVPSMKAKRGCPIAVNLLDSDIPIEVFVKLEEIRKSGNIIRIKGRGWPKLDTRGDLVIHVNVVPDKKGGSRKVRKSRKRHK